MRLVGFLLGFALGAQALDGAEVASELIPGEYIVVLQKHLPAERHAHHMMKMSMTNLTIAREYNINNGEFQAYHVTGIDDMQAQALTLMPEVRYVEQNVMGHVAQTCDRSPFATWGISRTVVEGGAPSGNVPYESTQDAAGLDVDVYVLDTGIQTTHVDYAGRATWNGGADYVNEGFNDEHGHGTHVASTIGGVQWGLARRSILVGVKVCTRGGSCPADAQLAGIQHVGRAASNPTKKSVGNMSIGSPFRDFINDAIEAMTNAGAIMVVAAGNENQNACVRSPSSAPFAWTVGATTNTDARSAFSNWGTCVNVFAPGSNVVAAWIGSNTATRSASGTSMASPHGAGIVAKYWSQNRNLSPIQVMRNLEQRANRNVVTNPGTGSPNLLAFMNCNTRA